MMINSSGQALSRDDEKQVRWWRKKYSRKAWLWAGLLALPLLLSALFFILFSREERLWAYIFMLPFMPFAAFFVYKLVNVFGKMRPTRTALRRGLKQVTTGTLQEVTADKHLLTYTIDHNTIKVAAPGPLEHVSGSFFLPGALIVLEWLPVTVQDNILLNVHYKDVPEATSIAGPADTAEKATLMMRWNSPTIKILFLTLAVPFGICLMVSERAREPAIMLGMLLFVAAMAVFLAGFTLIFNHRVQNAEQKITLTGVITEVFVSRYDNEGSGDTKIYWYRIGQQIVSGYHDDDRFLPGDKVCCVYLANKKGTQQGLFSIALL
ncbi:hypothetical protein AB6805_16075 [Chitinophaga sp. RCC_12]|uniref:hypothetical protein n=1 Tax=Chitinophaga sp. RCC_12 TaxID=3239226 RepID=UPI003523E2B1